MKVVAAIVNLLLIGQLSFIHPLTLSLSFTLVPISFYSCWFCCHFKSEGAFLGNHGIL